MENIAVGNYRSESSPHKDFRVSKVNHSKNAINHGVTQRDQYINKSEGYSRNSERPELVNQHFKHCSPSLKQLREYKALSYASGGCPGPLLQESSETPTNSLSVESVNYLTGPVFFSAPFVTVNPENPPTAMSPALLKPRVAPPIPVPL